MTVRYTPQGCRVETRYIIHPNYTQRMDITLSVDPANEISFATEEKTGQVIGQRTTEGKVRVRSTKHGFELYER
jgi:hypothetical protein